MRLRNVRNAKEIVDNSDYVVHNPFEYKGKYKELFGNEKTDCNNVDSCTCRICFGLQ